MHIHALLAPLLLVLTLLCGHFANATAQAAQTGADAAAPTAVDALAAIKASVGTIPPAPRLDADGDGAVTSSDARLILQRIVGKTPAAPPATAQAQKQSQPPASSKPAANAKLDELLGRADKDIQAREWDKALAGIGEASTLPDLQDAEKKRIGELRQTAEQGQVERRRRLDQIVAGANECGKENWQACRDGISGALTGSEPFFGSSDDGMVKKAKDLLAKAEKGLENAKLAAAQGEAERKRRLDLIVAGAGECGKENWAGCKDKLSSALSGSESVFGPQDAPMVAKARDLLAKAEKGLENAKLAAQGEAERKRRLDLIVAGAGECGKENWAGCKDKLSSALSGSESVFGPQDAPMVAKARDLLAKAEANLASKGSQQAKNEECEALFKQALAKDDKGDVSGAKTGYEMVIAMCPDNWKARNNLAFILEKKGDKKAALIQYEEALRLTPGNAKLQKNVADLKNAVGREKAEAAKKDKCDDLYDASYDKGEAGNRKGAIEGYMKVVEMCPDNCSAKNNIGYQYAMLDKDEQALPWYEAALQCDPQNKKYKANVEGAKKNIVATKCNDLSRQAYDKGAQGDATGAIAGYKQVLATCPKDCNAMNGVGYHSMKNGDKAGALSWYEAALKCDPGKEAYRNNVEALRKQLAAANQSASQTAQTTPAPPQASGVGQFDATYSGPFGGDNEGTVQFSITNGAVNGTITGPNTVGKIIGSVDAQGRITCNTSGNFFKSAFTGTFNGNVRGTQASGNWVSATKDVKGSGTWNASRQGGTAQNAGSAGSLASYNGAYRIYWNDNNGGKDDFVIEVTNGVISSRDKKEPLSGQVDPDGTLFFKISYNIEYLGAVETSYSGRIQGRSINGSMISKSLKSGKSYTFKWNGEKR